MKQAVSILFTTAFLLLSGSLLWSQQQDPLYENVVIETFDGAGSSQYPKGSYANVVQGGNTVRQDISGQNVVWSVNSPDGLPLASRYVTEGFPVIKYIPDSYPIDLFGTNPEDAAQKQSLGVRVKFNRQGYNYFAVYPGTEIDGKWSPQALPLTNNDRPGQVKNINVWVWGASFDYTIEMHVRDYRGETYVLPMRVVSGVDRSHYKAGTLRFVGWRKMAANVPSNVPQNGSYGLQDYRLRFVKFVIRTNPSERVDDFYIYFDQMQSTIDQYSNFYDGKDLTQPERVNEIWNSDGATNAAANTEAAAAAAPEQGQ